MKKIALSFALLLSATCLPAQDSPDAKALTAALKLRAEMADAVGKVYPGHKVDPGQAAEIDVPPSKPSP